MWTLVVTAHTLVRRRSHCAPPIHFATRTLSLVWVNAMPYDSVSAIIAYEHGELDDVETLDLFQYLVDTGLAWTLQGHYGRTAAAMLDVGVISLPSNGE